MTKIIRASVATIAREYAPVRCGCCDCPMPEHSGPDSRDHALAHAKHQKHFVWIEGVQIAPVQ